MPELTGHCTAAVGFARRKPRRPARSAGEAHKVCGLSRLKRDERRREDRQTGNAGCKNAHRNCKYDQSREDSVTPGWGADGKMAADSRRKLRWRCENGGTGGAAPGFKMAIGKRLATPGDAPSRGPCV